MTHRVMAALAAAALTLLVSVRAHAQARPGPPDLMTYEGMLVMPNGMPLGTNKPVNLAVVFRVFDAVTGGTLLWSEQQTVTVSQGRFGVLLGEGSVYANEPRPALSSVFARAAGTDRYLEFTIREAGAGGSDATLSPRTRLGSGAYALLAGHARVARRLVNPQGQDVWTMVGSRVGINQASPNAMLHVGGDALADDVVTTGSLTTAGTVNAEGFFGLGMAPVGTVVMWTGTTPPRGWVLCDGSVVGGVTTPDLRGRFILGAGDGAGLTRRLAGQQGGAEEHALTELEMPRHQHVVSFTGTLDEVTMGTHGYRVAVAGQPAGDLGYSASRYPNAKLQRVETSDAGQHRHRFNVPAFPSSSAGQGRPHNTMPPFHALAFIMRVQ